MGGQQQHLNGGVTVEVLHNVEPFLGLYTADAIGQVHVTVLNREKKILHLLALV